MIIWCVPGPPFYNGAGGLTTHKGRPRKRCKIALPECSPPSDGDPFAAPNFGNLHSVLEISCFMHITFMYIGINKGVLRLNRDHVDPSTI